MPAFSFSDPRFPEAIRTGRKTHTIRRREATGLKIGAWAPLYYKVRQKVPGGEGFLIGSGLINRSHEIRLDFDLGGIWANGAVWTTGPDLNAFARSDGFDSWADMEAFWAANYPGVRQFTGQLMGWSEFTPEKRLG